MLVLRPGALGDTLLAVPALRGLRRLRRFGPLTLAAHGGAARLLAALGEIDHGIAFDDPSLGWLFSAAQAPEEPGVAWLNTQLVPGLKQPLVIAPSRPADAELHCGQYLLDTLGSLGVDPVMDARPLAVRVVRSDEVLVHPGSGAAAKNWPPAQFARTIAALGSRPVRLIVGEADAPAAATVEALLQRPLPRLEHVPLEQLAAHLAGCHAYLGNDSGISHLAGLCGTRTVALFGPTSPKLWRPLGPNVHVSAFESAPEQVAALLEDST